MLMMRETILLWNLSSLVRQLHTVILFCELLGKYLLVSELRVAHIII